MKIFNWVQRRLNPNNSKDSGLGQRMKKKAEFVGAENVLESWKDGILTIGTFGYDPLKSFCPQKEEHHLHLPRTGSRGEHIHSEERQDMAEEEEEEDDSLVCHGHVNSREEKGDQEEHNNTIVEDEEELNPLIFTKLRGGCFEFEEELGLFDHHVVPKPTSHEIIVAVEEEELNQLKPVEMDSNYNKSLRSSKRTTLADLFSADSEPQTYKSAEFAITESIQDGGRKKPPPPVVASAKHAIGTNSNSLAKKFIHHIGIGDNPRPVKKLHKLMRKMLKRKIHPELDGQTHDKVEENQRDDDGAVDESLALLHTHN